MPYGPKFNAAKVERLLFKKDLLLNSEWNAEKDRKVNLHRHPTFFWDAAHILHDCCGNCPVPVTDEEKEVAEKEGKTYISGDVSFIKDNLGRQEIGSFNPITDLDGTGGGVPLFVCVRMTDRDRNGLRWQHRESLPCDREPRS